jgi:hypothetical protein
VFASVAGTPCIGFPPRRKSRLFKSQARGRVFKRGKLIDRAISAASKFSSVIDKNRDGGAAVMPAISRRDPCQNLLRKNNDRQKGASSSVPSNAARG